SARARRVRGAGAAGTARVIAWRAERAASLARRSRSNSHANEDCGKLCATFGSPRIPRPSSVQPYELFVGLRYTRAKRRNHFISFISMASMVGIAVGVMALIVVLSVMNGFQKELRARILGVASHVQITGFDGRLENWQTVAQQARANAKVIAAAPYVNAQALLSNQQAGQRARPPRVGPTPDDEVSGSGPR